MLEGCSIPDTEHKGVVKDEIHHGLHFRLPRLQISSLGFGHQQLICDACHPDITVFPK